jgi:hypothetical protein
MKPSPGIAFVVGLLLGVVAGALAIRSTRVQKPPEPSPALANTAPAMLPETDVESLTSSFDWSKWSGDWASVDGRQSAKIEGRFLRFQDTKGWPDLTGRTFLIGNERLFLSESGLYNIFVLDSEADRMSIIKEDLGTKELTSFTLYRDGTASARSRQPLPEAVTPPEIQALIDFIPEIRKGESYESVMSRCPSGIQGLEILDYESRSGETRVLLNLGKSNEWLLRVSHGDSGLFRFQVVRGLLEDGGKELLEITEYLYPSYADGKIITSVSGTGLHQWKPADPP